MTDFRKLIVAIVVAILFTIFVNTAIEAIYPQPQYNDYCEDRYMIKPYENMSPDEIFQNDKAMQECNDLYQTEMDKYNLVVFIISAVTGLIAIIVGMYIPTTSATGMAIASGFLLGGLFTLFFGTMRGWQGIGKIIRPIIMLIELAVIIWVAYRQFEIKKPKAINVKEIKKKK